MLRHLASASILIIFGTLILAASIFRVASVKYTFKLDPTPFPDNLSQIDAVSYSLPYPGRIEPSDFFWSLKVLRDKLWLTFNMNPLKKAEISLLLADKRLVSGKKMFDSNEVNTGISVLQKSELYLSESVKYLVEAEAEEMDITSFVGTLSLASVKHRAILETILSQAPEDAKPFLIEIINHPKEVYEQTSHIMNSLGREPAPNPFTGQ